MESSVVGLSVYFIFLIFLDKEQLLQATTSCCFLFVFVCMFARSAIIVYVASLNINFSLECLKKIDFCHVEFVSISCY